jgi:hypothetical protein
MPHVELSIFLRPAASKQPTSITLDTFGYGAGSTNAFPVFPMRFQVLQKSFSRGASAFAAICFIALVTWWADSKMITKAARTGTLLIESGEYYPDRLLNMSLAPPLIALAALTAANLSSIRNHSGTISSG